MHKHRTLRTFLHASGLMLLAVLCLIFACLDRPWYAGLCAITMLAIVHYLGAYDGRR